MKLKGKIYINVVRVCDNDIYEVIEEPLWRTSLDRSGAIVKRKQAYREFHANDQWYTKRHFKTVKIDLSKLKEDQ